MPQLMVPKQFRNPRPLTSILTVLKTLKPWTLGFINRLVTLQGRSQDFPKGVLNSADAFSTDKNLSPATTFSYFQ